MKQGELETLFDGKLESRKVITCEAGIRQGWEHWCKDKHNCFSLECFGLSGKGSEVASRLSFTAQDLACLIDKI